MINVDRVFNFNPGPATLPEPVLREVQQELLEYRKSGMSIIEMSHRSTEVEQVVAEAEELLRNLLGIGEEHKVLFLQGGASLQFAMIPINFLSGGRTADYLITGSFAEKAYQEALKVGQVHVAGSTADGGYRRVLREQEITLSDDPVYVHLTSNNTIYGTQWQTFPDFGHIPVVADMSSDILSRPLEMDKFSLIYAGAQKNLGPAGVTVVVISTKFMEKSSGDVPSILGYSAHAKNDSLYNTPPVFSIYVMHRVLRWVRDAGGVNAMEARNRTKAGVVYAEIDASDGFYQGHAESGSRSTMNVTFTLRNKDSEKSFLASAEETGLVGLKGHRSVGGIRASLYNAMSVEGSERLAEFMRKFRLEKC